MNDKFGNLPLETYKLHILCELHIQLRFSFNCVLLLVPSRWQTLEEPLASSLASRSSHSGTSQFRIIRSLELSGRNLKRLLALFNFYNHILLLCPIFANCKLWGNPWPLPRLFLHLTLGLCSPELSDPWISL